MTAFPSGSGNHIPTDNLNQSTDKPKNARDDLYNLALRMNEVIDSFNANSGICGLTSSGKVDSAKLIGQIDTNQLVADAVDGTKIANDSINSEHIVDGSVDKIHTSFISQATIDNTATNDVVPTQLAVKSFVDSEVGAVDTTMPYAILTKSSFSTVNGSSTNDPVTGFTISNNGVTVTQSGDNVSVPSGIYIITYSIDTCTNPDMPGGSAVFNRMGIKRDGTFQTRNEFDGSENSTRHADALTGVFIGGVDFQFTLGQRNTSNSTSRNVTGNTITVGIVKIA